MREQLHLCIEATQKNTGPMLILALSYSGRVEIVEAVQSIIREIKLGHLDSAQIDEQLFHHHLYTRYYPDPDLLIRTSGEMRLSNFLLWQLSYTEIYVTPTLWPDFRAQHLADAIVEYGNRQRGSGRCDMTARTDLPRRSQLRGGAEASAVAATSRRRTCVREHADPPSKAPSPEVDGHR